MKTNAQKLRNGECIAIVHLMNDDFERAGYTLSRLTDQQIDDAVEQLCEELAGEGFTSKLTEAIKYVTDLKPIY